MTFEEVLDQAMAMLQRRGRLGHWRSGAWWHRCTTHPDQDTAVLIHCQALAVNEFVLEGLEVLVIELEVQLEGPIGQASPPLQHGHRLVQHLLKGHGLPLPVAWDSRIASFDPHRTTFATSI